MLQHCSSPTIHTTQGNIEQYYRDHPLLAGSITDDETQDSLLEYHVYSHDDTSDDDASCTSVLSDSDSAGSCPSFFDGDTHSASTDGDDSDNDTFLSQATSTSIASFSSLNGDPLPKTFLQVHGIMVANYNMACNFSVEAAIRLMDTYELSIYLSWQFKSIPLRAMSYMTVKKPQLNIHVLSLASLSQYRKCKSLSLISSYWHVTAKLYYIRGGSYHQKPFRNIARKIRFISPDIRSPALP